MTSQQQYEEDTIEIDDNIFVPRRFVCPVSAEIFYIPYKTKYGHHFEGTVIKSWISEKHNCPLTRQALERNEVFIDHLLMKEIKDYVLANNLYEYVFELPILDYINKVNRLFAIKSKRNMLLRLSNIKKYFKYICKINRLIQNNSYTDNDIECYITFITYLRKYMDFYMGGNYIEYNKYVYINFKKIIVFLNLIYEKDMNTDKINKDIKLLFTGLLFKMYNNIFIFKKCKNLIKELLNTHFEIVEDLYDFEIETYDEEYTVFTTNNIHNLIVFNIINYYYKLEFKQNYSKYVKLINNGHLKKILSNIYWNY